MRVVVSAVAAKVGGVATYVTSFLPCLPGAESGHEFVVFLSPDLAKSQPKLNSNVRLVPVALSKANWLRRLWWDQVTLRRYLKKEGADVLFSSANFAMFRCPVRQILLVRMLLYFARGYLEMILPRHPLKWRTVFALRRWLCCESVRQADVVMTPTRAMLDDLRRFVEVDSRKALVNPYGVDPVHLSHPVAERSTRASGSGIASTIRLIYVSLYGEHKNLATLLKAMPLLNRDQGAKFFLKTPVNPGWEGAAWTVTAKEDLQLACHPDVAPWVQFLRPLDRQQSRELYEEAHIFVFPSLCESFGHPMVEAMAHGLPIVASDTPVNRELCGDAAVYFSPLSPAELAQQVRHLAEDHEMMAKLGAAGRERAARDFRWDRHVARLLEAAQSDRLVDWHCS